MARELHGYYYESTDHQNRVLPGLAEVRQAREETKSKKTRATLDIAIEKLSERAIGMGAAHHDDIVSSRGPGGYDG